jgi:4-amino-4-deoxychorismate lyase
MTVAAPTPDFAPRCFIDGEPADAVALARITQFNVGHFTSMQVRDRAVLGLDLHMARLVRDAREVFDAALDPQQVRKQVLEALGEVCDASVRVTVFAKNWSLRQLDGPAQLGFMIGVAAPHRAGATPLRLWPVEHERFLPHIKHVATFDLFALRRRARSEGFDDALFMDRAGRISEGTTWNIGFFDGRRVIWPQAAQLDGVTMRLLRRALEAEGVESQVRPLTLAQAGEFPAAFICNAGVWTQPVVRIGGTEFSADADFFALLAHAGKRIEPGRL